MYVIDQTVKENSSGHVSLKKKKKNTNKLPSIAVITGYSGEATGYVCRTSPVIFPV